MKYIFITNLFQNINANSFARNLIKDKNSLTDTLITIASHHNYMFFETEEVL
jgi:hypothetical protein